jgi:hypothetical protein
MRSVENLRELNVSEALGFLSGPRSGDHRVLARRLDPWNSTC